MYYYSYSQVKSGYAADERHDEEAAPPQTVDNPEQRSSGILLNFIVIENHLILLKSSSLFCKEVFLELHSLKCILKNTKHLLSYYYSTCHLVSNCTITHHIVIPPDQWFFSYLFLEGGLREYW